MSINKRENVSQIFFSISFLHHLTSTSHHHVLNRLPHPPQKSKDRHRDWKTKRASIFLFLRLFRDTCDLLPTVSCPHLSSQLATVSLCDLDPPLIPLLTSPTTSSLLQSASVSRLNCSKHWASFHLMKWLQGCWINYLDWDPHKKPSQGNSTSHKNDYSHPLQNWKRRSESKNEDCWF